MNGGGGRGLEGGGREEKVMFLFELLCSLGREEVGGGRWWMLGFGERGGCAAA